MSGPAYYTTSYIIGDNLQFYLTNHSTVSGNTGKTLDVMIIEKAQSKGYPIYSRKDVKNIPPFIFGDILSQARKEF